MTTEDVARLESERLRPSPLEHTHDWRDDLDQLIAVLAQLLGHRQPHKATVVAGSYGYSPARGTARETP